MAILPINTFPDAVLRQRAEEVADFDAALERLVSDMLDTMYDAPGVGLAANQIGLLMRVAVIDVDYEIESDEENTDPAPRKYKGKNPRVFVNPVITKRTGATPFKEGCLSVPGFYEDVKRAVEVDVTYQDIKGTTHTLHATGLLAIALQHEVDHLDGRLFVDHLSPIKRSLIQSKVKKERARGFERSKFHVEL